MYLEILKSIFLGLLKEITEWLPIPSTGHLILVEEFAVQESGKMYHVSMFNVVIQLGVLS